MQSTQINRQTTVTDPEFPRRGTPTPKGAANLFILANSLHEIEKNEPRGGDQLGSANVKTSTLFLILDISYVCARCLTRGHMEK